jgi:hypothetical protein
MTHEDDNPERPAIHVSLASEANERFYEWIAIGAEEEGIPCRLADAEEADDEADAAALAHAAAQNSRLDVGIGVASGQVAVQVRHMPAERPVIVSKVEEARARHVCRSAGSNAARLVIGTSLRLDEEP